MIPTLLFRILAALVTWLLLACPVPALAQAGQDQVLQVFTREGCPHCAEARAYLEDFARLYPDLVIVYREVGTEDAARDELMRLAAAAGTTPGVPAFAFNENLLIGFTSAEVTGPYLVALVERRQGDSSEITTGVFGTLSVDRLGLPLFTLAIGLLDGFNPCAMWVLLFLLSMLVHLHDRKRMALIAGTFVVVSGAVYYAFMAAWLNFFLVVGMTTGLRIILSIIALAIGWINVRDYLGSTERFALSIPEAAKPSIYSRVRRVLQAETLVLSMTGVAALAVMVNFIELLCTAGFPAMYTAILTQQGLPPAGYYAYLGLYILGYMADDSVMVATAVLALGSRRLTERSGRLLKLVSGLVMLLLGLIMIMKPAWLF